MSEIIGETLSPFVGKTVRIITREIGLDGPYHLVRWGILHYVREDTGGLETSWVEGLTHTPRTFFTISRVESVVEMKPDIKRGIFREELRT